MFSYVWVITQAIESLFKSFVQVGGKKARIVLPFGLFYFTEKRINPNMHQSFGWCHHPDGLTR